MSENPQRDKAALDMKVARADAIHAYASLEQSLSGFLALLMQTEAKLAGVVFYRMGAVQRNKAIEILLEYRFKGQYDNYWHGTKGEPGKPGKPGLLSIVRTLDEIRNQIVHWSIAVSVGGGEPVESLIPPNIWAWVEDGRDLTIEEIREFTAKANFAHRSIMMFTLFHRPDFPAAFDEETKRTWLEIFQQPCTYPPSKEHPLGPKT